jgi:septation ring formation regulator EzrA
VTFPLVLRTTYAALQQRYSGVSAQLVDAQDEVRALRDRLATAEAELRESRADGLAAREMVANFLSQRVFGDRVFGAPRLPETPQDKELLDSYNTRQRGARARDLVRDAERAFRQQLAEKAAEGGA